MEGGRGLLPSGLLLLLLAGAAVVHRDGVLGLLDGVVVAEFGVLGNAEA